MTDKIQKIEQTLPSEKIEQPELKQPEKIEQPKWRQIIIETDGNNIRVNKAEVAGNLEFTSILSRILNKIKIN